MGFVSQESSKNRLQSRKMITNVLVYCCVHFSYVQRISNYSKIKSYKENRDWLTSYLLHLWYLIVHDAFKIKLQEINSSWLDFNKSLQLVQVTTQSYFDKWIHTVISLLNHYMCTNHRNTICHTFFWVVVSRHLASTAQYFKGSLCLHIKAL